MQRNESISFFKIKNRFQSKARSTVGQGFTQRRRYNYPETDNNAKLWRKMIVPINVNALLN